MKGADVFAQYVENGCEKDKYEGLEDINRVVNPEGANGWAVVKTTDHKAIWKWCQPGVKGMEMMLRSFLFLPIVNILLFLKSWISNQSFKSKGLYKKGIQMMCNRCKITGYFLIEVIFLTIKSYLN